MYYIIRASDGYYWDGSKFQFWQKDRKLFSSVFEIETAMESSQILLSEKENWFVEYNGALKK